MDPFTNNFKSRDEYRQMLDSKFGIFELRGLGRELGVPSPTTKRRDDLIDCIVERVYAGEPVKKNSNMGRPFKKLGNLNELLSSVTQDEEQGALTYEQIIKFAQELPPLVEISQDYFEFKGVIHKVKNFFFFVDEGAKIFLTEKDFRDWNLREGDFVEVYAKKVDQRNQYKACLLKSINFNSSGLKLPEVEFGKPIISNDKLPYGNFELHCGRRNLLFYKNNLYEDDRFLKFSEFCKKNDYRLITVSLNSAYEDMIMFSEMEDSVTLSTTYGDDMKDGVSKVVDAIALAQRLLETGRKCVVFVNDIMEVLDVLDHCFDETSDNGHKQKALVIVKKLLSLGKALSNGASITLVMTYRESDVADKFLNNELKKICSEFK